MILFLLQGPHTSQAAWKALTLTLPQRHCDKKPSVKQLGSTRPILCREFHFNQKLHPRNTHTHTDPAYTCHLCNVSQREI